MSNVEVLSNTAFGKRILKELRDRYNDYDINILSKSELFNNFLDYNGIIGLTGTIKEAINVIYNIDIEKEDNTLEKINDIIWKNLVHDIQSLGYVILNPNVHDSSSIMNKLGYADSTILLIHNLELNKINIDPLLLEGKELLNFLYNAINSHKIEDAKVLISDTALWRIVDYTSPVADIINFPEDAIPIIKDFLVKKFKK